MFSITQGNQASCSALLSWFDVFGNKKHKSTINNHTESRYVSSYPQ